MFTYRIKSVLSLALIILSFNLSATVYESVSDGNWNANKTWTPNKPNPNWNNTNDTIIIKHIVSIPQNISLYGQTLIIESNGKLDGDKKIELSNASALIVDGELDIKEVKMTWGQASFVNNGDVNLNSFSASDAFFTNNSNFTVVNTILNDWNNVFTNSGNISADDFVNNGDSLLNSGSINLTKDFKANSSNQIYMSNSGSINAARDFQYYLNLDNSGDINVGRSYLADWNSTTNNSGEITVESNFDNRGIFTSSDDVWIKGNADNAGEIILTAANFKVEGDMLNDWGSDLNNSASLEILGDLNNRNTISNTGNIAVSNDIVNKGSVTNSNYISVGNNFIVRFFASSVSNNGVIAVNQNLENEGNISNNGNLMVDGIATSTGVIDGSGDLCNSDGQTDPTQGSKSITCNICGTDASTLPVELSYFEADVNETEVVLNWITESEINNHYFEVQKSLNGEDFETISTVNGNGNSTTQIQYSAIDNNPENGISYYRLKQVDYDGSFEYSNTIAVEMNIESEIQANVFPNPAKIGDNLNINLNTEQELNIKLYTIEGRLVYNQMINSNNHSINTSNFNNGIYILKISSSRTAITSKIQIVK